jgi:hypothetical protein
VQRAQALESDPRVQLGDDRVQRGSVGHVAARHVQVARVQADAEPRVGVEALVQKRELVDRASDRPAGAGGVLHQQPGRVRAAVEHVPHRRLDALDAGFEPGAEVRADMEDDAVGLDRAGDVDGGRQRRDRLLVDRVVGGGEVAEVERVAEHRADPGLRALFAEGRVGVRVGGRHSPRPRALREQLHGVGADLDRAVERALHAARAVGPQEHPPTIVP